MIVRRCWPTSSFRRSGDTCTKVDDAATRTYGSRCSEIQCEKSVSYLRIIFYKYLVSFVFQQKGNGRENLFEKYLISFFAFTAASLREKAEAIKQILSFTTRPIIIPGLMKTIARQNVSLQLSRNLEKYYGVRVVFFV